MSFTKGLSFVHETNASSKTSCNPSITNNISIHASNEVSESSQYKVLDTSEVKYEPTGIPINNTPESPSVINEIEFLKKVLLIYMSQKFYFSGKFLVLKPDELLDIIETLLPDKQITINCSEIEELGCCGFGKDIPIKKIETIWVSKDDVQQNFKYCYSNLVSLLDQYKISIKFVRAQ